MLPCFFSQNIDKNQAHIVFIVKEYWIRVTYRLFPVR